VTQSMKTGLLFILGALALSSACRAAPAAPLPLTEIQTTSRQTNQYTCATGKIFEVTYWNTANGQSFALVPVKGQQLLFVNTMAASGVRYQAGSYIWWTKGPRADLYDAMNGENAPPILSDCITIVR